ncbi:zinc finger CCCH domain-containing protein 14 [Teleopsis dalmanni]|uniref:zinc finger CCCH domain-containing protein 14 n=1 Tax=Teleopsis dalmanni TaxID=139649 RepID=UPI0018CE74D9|nr:zinc finger CCCH domain-containing protein 14 [Teleopsis dalmanni]
MENFGSEVGQKMRSAVKAKLIELGTGGSAGYIDDELPDYVMIMVANKRSKEQMIADLNLFLGDHTELFVTWLHEVLQKLQEVTLPASIATARKRKNTEKDEIQNRKDKKANKRDKKNAKKSNEKSTEKAASVEKTTVDEPDEIITICSITDVFAEEFLQKAKKTTEESADTLTAIKKSKNKNNDDLATSSNHTQKTNEFDIPTISEISSTTESGNRSREDDLAELAKIQQQIYIAKKQLKQSGELDKNLESEDEDFLNLKDEDGSGDEFAESEDLPQKSTRQTSPIVFEQPTENVENLMETNNSPDKSHVSKKNEKQCVSFDNFRNMNNYVKSPTKRRPVHERLGIASHISRSRITSNEQKLVFEKNIQNHLQKNIEINKSNERKDFKIITKQKSSDELNNARIFKLALPDNNKESMEKSTNASSTNYKNQRIGSRVIVAPAKFNFQNEEDEIEKPVNSVIKIKPRPVVPAAKQACKNLLLRAMADAQRSTITTKSTGRKKTESKLNVRSNSIDNRNTKLFTKSYRNKIKHNAASAFMKSAQNFVIEVNGKWQNTHLNRKEGSEDELSLDEQYEPKSTSDKGTINAGYIYVPKTIADDDIDYKRDDLKDDDWNYAPTSMKHSNTQFVVTLNDKKKVKTREVNKIRNRSYSPIPQVSSSTGSRRYEVTSSSTSRRARRSRSRSRSQSTQRQNRKNSQSYDDDGTEVLESTSSCNTPPTLRRTELIETYRKPHQVNKLIIKNDSEDDMYPRKGYEPYGDTKNNSSNSNKMSDRSTTPPLPPKVGNSADDQKDNEVQSNTAEARKHTLIKYDVKKDDRNSETHKTSTRSRKIVVEEKAQSTSDYLNHEESRKIVIRNTEDKKYDNIPSLNSVALNIASIKTNKPKERCKYHPNCTKQFCEFYHPSAACKSFPNCKFADKCIYTHPKCKFDVSCTNGDCNFAHSGPRNCSLQLTAPPLSSHVIPVQNYKSISALPSAVSATMCKFYPNCSKVGCTFYHPKPCRFGKNCINKLECNFYHHETQSSNKFKWVASVI